MEQWYIKNKNSDISVDKMDLLKKTKLRILLNRDIKSLDDIKDYFLNPLSKLGKATQFNDFHLFLEKINEAIKNKKTVAIVGDYDVDGIMSTAILLKTFSAIGLDSIYMIPNRVEDGYGINIDIVDKLKSKGVDFIITVDNGIQAFDTLEYAQSVGIEVFVTDHHEIRQDDSKDVLPVSVGVINPHRADSTYPFEKLCGAGIAYIISKELLDIFKICDINLNNEILAFAGIATICDVVDLVGENRIIAHHGLLAIRNTTNIGLLKLLEKAGIEKEKVDSYHVGFVIGPRLNAGGRLEIADLGVELLTTNIEDRANKIAEKLNSLNELRKNMTEIGYKKAIGLIDNNEIPNFIVLYLDNTHESIAGIIAGRIKDKYYRPTIILTDGKDGLKGSGRSIEEYDIFNAVSEHVNLLDKFGGHTMACGLSMKRENLDEFAKKVNDDAEPFRDDFIKKVYVEALFPIEMIDMRFLDMINAFRPFGKANEEPLFADTGLKVLKVNIYGKNRNVVKMKLLTKSNVIREAVLFENEDDFVKKARVNDMNEYEKYVVDNLFIDIVYYPKLNEFRGQKNVDINIKSYRYRNEV